MPCGPGLHWTYQDKNDKERPFYTKQPLTYGTSMSEVRFLNFLMHYDARFQDSNGIPYVMEHAFHRGQVEINGLKVDGFVETPEQTIIVEFNG